MSRTSQDLMELMARWNREFVALAQAWMQLGAQGFAIIVSSAPDALVFAYPADLKAERWALEIPFPLQHFKGLRLCIQQIDPDKRDAVMRLIEACVPVFTTGIDREFELDTMTKEVVHYQDLVVALYELNSALSRPLSLTEMLDVLLEHVCRLTGAMGGVALLETSQVIFQTLHVDVQMEQITPCFQILKGTKSKLNSIRTDGTSLLCLPLVMPEHHPNIGGMIGLISSAPLGSPQIKLAKAILQQAGTQVQNILHFEERVYQARMQTELDLARAVQIRLLPAGTITLAGLDISGESRAAYEVGGDFFDYFTASDVPFMFALGDVSGKGLSAALVMTMARTAIRSAATSGTSPLTIMQMVSNNLYDDLTDLDKLTTVVIGKADAEQRCITFANAGHAPVVYAAPDAPATLLEADAPPLGVMPNYDGENHTIELSPDGLLIIATDGFVEAENAAGEMFGYTRFLETIDSIKMLSAEQIRKALYDTVSEFRGATSPQSDDQTIIVIKRVSRAETV